LTPEGGNHFITLKTSITENTNPMETLMNLSPAAPPGPLQLSLSPRISLVKLDTVIAARGEYAQMISAHVDRGTLRWVFNVAANPSGIRDLRFWTREVAAFASGRLAEHVALRHLPVDAVIDEILGGVQQFHSGDVCLLLGIRRPTLLALRDELLTAGRQYFQRRALAAFLKRRLAR